MFHNKNVFGKILKKSIEELEGKLRELEAIKGFDAIKEVCQARRGPQELLKKYPPLKDRTEKQQADFMAELDVLAEREKKAFEHQEKYGGENYIKLLDEIFEVKRELGDYYQEKAAFDFYQNRNA